MSMKMRRPNMTSRGATASPAAAHNADSAALLRRSAGVRSRARQKERGENHRHRRERNRQPLHADRHAKHLVERRDDPVAQNRFVQPRLVVECGADEIAALQHLARRLDVERFVGIPDRRTAQIDEVRQDRLRSGSTKSAQRLLESLITNHSS